jgi:hypothetical protein
MCPFPLPTQRRRVEAEKVLAIQKRAGGGGVGGTTAGAARGGGGPAGAKGGHLGALLRQQQAAVTAEPWQLLQLADTSTPGRFKVCSG